MSAPVRNPEIRLVSDYENDLELSALLLAFAFSLGLQLSDGSRKLTCDNNPQGRGELGAPALYRAENTADKSPKAFQEVSLTTVPSKA